MPCQKPNDKHTQLLFGLLLILLDAFPRRQTGRKGPTSSSSPVPIPLPPGAGTRGRKQQLLSKFISALFSWVRGRKASEVNWHSLKANPMPLPAPAPLQTRMPVPKHKEPCSTKMRLLLLDFSHQRPGSGPPAGPPKAEGKAGLLGTVLKHGHEQLEEMPLLVPGGQHGACCGFSRRVGGM